MGDTGTLLHPISCAPSPALKMKAAHLEDIQSNQSRIRISQRVQIMVYIQRYTILTARKAVQGPCQQNARDRALVCQEVMLKWRPPQDSLRADLGMTEFFLTYVTEKTLFWELFLWLKTENQDETM